MPAPGSQRSALAVAADRLTARVALILERVEIRSADFRVEVIAWPLEGLPPLCRIEMLDMGVPARYLLEEHAQVQQALNMENLKWSSARQPGGTIWYCWS